MGFAKHVRGPGDPLWNGRIVRDSKEGWDLSDNTAKHAYEHLRMALERVDKLRHVETSGPSGQGVVPQAQMFLLAEAYELVENLQRYLPWIKAWCLGWETPAGKDGTPAHFDVLSAHTTKDKAEHWRGYFQLLSRRQLDVRLLPVPVIQLRSSAADPQDAANSWFRGEWTPYPVSLEEIGGDREAASS